ncbi:amidohydrolase/deacetylase family metallohydrolase [Psychromarinibacter sp. C21-152]|uniref:Amidohydrolase/deacetylase family metallohydrolase n=1 Tax=Psychromarinibacter sediminicola TaxID=3033385 RepID=A0AAE3NUI2_9RHOB|nr:amidohydrolase/deacetylase family metallohydrolase [Psychromarinibacter sediminicola]MDF0601215.1 amidohydrolase/deacetylase family metallohydrolase [Psychromarinibacter sediminicola]
MSFDLLLRNGRVIDPAQGLDGVQDLAFKDGKVAAIGPSISGEAAEVSDVSGLIVTPGLIDLHTHVYWGGTSLGIDADDFARSSAVTTAVDTGSAGPGNYAGFRKHVIEPATARILAYLHVSFAGIFAFSNRIMIGESQDWRLLAARDAAEVAVSDPDTIIGIKVRVGRHASGPTGIHPLTVALQVADETGLPLMCHIDEPPPSYEEVVDLLRPGDVLTHCFRPFPNAPLAGDGTVKPAVQRARDRGVMFDIGHGKGSFGWRTARGMMAQGFAPDVISSDVHALCIDGPAYDQVTTLSKFLPLGMSLPEIVRASTETPAKAVRRPELGSLKVGTPGDASILSLQEGAFELEDVLGETVTTDKRIFAEGCVIGGKWFREAGKVPA